LYNQQKAQMTEKANPSINRPAEAFKTAGAIAYGGSDEGFISPANSPTEISIQDAGINESSLNAFDETSSSSSLDVTIDGGEAFVFGSWLAKDTPTTVSLEADSSSQTVFVGWNRNGADDVIIGLSAAYSSASGDADQKIPLFTFDTDASGVTSVTDERSFDQISASSVEQGAGSGLDADTVDGVEASALTSSGSIDVLSNGSTVASDADGLDFTDSLSISNNGDGTSTIDVDDVFVENTGDTMSGDLDMGSNKVTNLADPVNGSDAATKQFAESLTQGINVKESARASSAGDGNIDLSSSTDPTPLDGVQIDNGDRVLLLEQNDGAENGIYDAVTATDPSTWVRSSDSDEGGELKNGSLVSVLEGDSGGGIGFIVTTQGTPTLGSTDINFSSFTDVSEREAGRGLTVSGNEISVEDIFLENSGDTVTGNLSLLDDVQLQLGSDSDFAIEFDSSAGELQVIDTTNGTVSMKFDKSGNVLVPGGDIVLSGSNTVENVASPTNDTDVATKAFAEDKAAAPSYDNHRVALQNKFGAEGSTTTSSGFTTIAGSDISFSPENYRDDSGQLAIRLHYHVKGDITIRIVRQNAGTVVSGTEVSGTFGSAFGELDTGWVTFGDSGFESYQIQMRSNDGNDVSYNSVLLDYGHPQ
jgi:hypothetical protein